MADSLGAYLATQLELSDDQREVVAFGALALLQNGASALLLLVLAQVSGVLPETVTALSAAAVLRHATGGTHLQTPLRCVGATALAFWATGSLGHSLAQAPLTAVTALAATLPVVALGTWVIHRWAPVEAETRPLSSRHKAHLRRLSLQLGWLIAAILVVGASVNAWWWAPGLLGYFVQCTTLTPPGHRLTGMIDHWFNRLQGR